MRKIMFSDKFGLTKAVLEGRKTMTRRVVPECKALDILRLWERNEGAVATGYEEKTQSFRFDYCPDIKRRISIDHLNLIPGYKFGEVVAVAQSYDTILKEHRGQEHIGIWANVIANRNAGCAGDSNKMFVRADLMPHQIRITNIRVERLQDISDEDCLEEGIYQDETASSCYQPFYTFHGSIDKDVPVGYHTLREAFAALIDKVSGNGTFESNPWVFVYEFELVQ